MVIVLECPGCSKRYEVDAALAGKKSRCKQCGEVFKIPVPTAIPAAPPPNKPARPASSSAPAGAWQTVLERPRPPAKTEPAESWGRTDAEPSRRTRQTIILNCPACKKRYEIDGKLAGKRSRCKECGEVFSIPTPRAPGGGLDAASPSGRATASPLPGYWESVLEENEPASLKASRGPEQSTFDQDDLPPPPHGAYPKPQRKSYARRSSSSNPNIGFTIAGIYAALAILVVMGFYIWMAAAKPGNDRIGQVFAITVVFMHGTALLMSLAGNIWMLVVAFKEKLAQGLFCLLVPCYAFYYIITRWEDTKGAFMLMLLPLGNMLVFFAMLLGPGISAAREGYERARQAQQAQRADLNGLATSAKPGLTANRARVRQFEESFNAGATGREREPKFPPDADAVAKSLIQLKSPEISKKKEALQRLERTPPDERLAEVVATLVPLLNDDDGFLVCDAIKVLTVWKSPDGVPAVIERTSDNRFNVRHEAIKALGKLKDPRGVEPIIARLNEDGFQAVDALKAMGPIAEPALIQRLTNPDSDIRKRACEVLKEIGGRDSLKAMQALPADPDFFVRVAAKDAMKTIAARVGPLPASDRKGTADAGASSQRRPKR
jgi:hypothetical protein